MWYDDSEPRRVDFNPADDDPYDYEGDDLYSEYDMDDIEWDEDFYGTPNVDPYQLDLFEEPSDF